MKRLCALIFLIAFAVRFAGTLRHPPEPDNVYESTRVALSLARNGAFADPFIVPTGPTAHVAPAFPLLLSLVYRAFGEGTEAEIAKRFLNCFVSSLQYALLPWLATVCGLSRGAGVAAAFFGALIPLQRYAESAGSWESSWAALLLMLLVAATRRQWPGSLYGALWGVALLFAPALAGVYAGFLWLLRRRWQAMVISVLVTAVCLFPWAYRNHRQLGSWIWMRDNFGLELGVSNQEHATARLSENLRSGYHNASHPHGSIAEANRVRDLGEVEYNRRKLHEALQWIARNPGRFAHLTSERAFDFWFPWTASAPQRLLLGLVTILALAGLIRTWSMDRFTARIFAIVWLTFPLVYDVVEFDRRYRHPIEWSLLLMAAQGACAGACLIWERIRQRKVL